MELTGATASMINPSTSGKVTVDCVEDSENTGAVIVLADMLGWCAVNG